MAVQRKRKHVADDDQQAGKQTRPVKAQKSIHQFGTLGKPHAEGANAKKPKATAKAILAPSVSLAPGAKADSQKMDSKKPDSKRKRSAVVEESDDEITLASNTASSKKDADPKVTSTPRNKRFKNAMPSPAETPSRGTAALFDRLKIDPNSRAIPLTLQRPLDTPPLTPTEEQDAIDLSFPPQLEDLLDLHASFLTALGMYYAHNGTSSPVDMRTLLPLVTKHWKKRKVTLEDLQRILGLSQKEPEFDLQDYGKAGICLTKTQARGRALKRAASYIDEEEQNRRFEDRLQKAWHTWQSATPKENRTATAFVDQLPFAEIPQHESVNKAAPVFARGQQRLADLKAGQTAARAQLSQTPVQPTLLPKALQAPQNRGTALLDRILAKQSLASSLPAGPTREQLERKSALHRIEDVARILSLLAGGKERCSFSLPAITQQIQQSLRNPISREEVERCLTLMGSDITPGFVRILQSGEVKGVVIARSFNVGLVELRARVERACA